MVEERLDKELTDMRDLIQRVENRLCPLLVEESDYDDMEVEKIVVAHEERIDPPDHPCDDIRVSIPVDDYKVEEDTKKQTKYQFDGHPNEAYHQVEVEVAAHKLEA